MKYVLPLLMLACLPVWAQDRIEGIGPFRIGKTKIDITTSIAKELTGRIEQIKYGVYVDDQEMYLGKARINELVQSDRPDLVPPRYVSFCPGVRVFRINRYIVADMELRSIYLVFKDETLIRIECQGGLDLNEALEIKYGDASFVTTTDTTKCYSRIAGERPLIEKRQNRSWANGDIMAINRVMLRYDSRCEAYNTIDLNIFSQSATEQILICESQLNDNRIERRKRNLKDF